MRIFFASKYRNIKSCNFSHKSGTDFTECKGGHNLLINLFLLNFGIILCGACGVLSVFPSGLVYAIYNSFNNQIQGLFFVVVALSLYVLHLGILVWRGFDIASLIFVITLIIVGLLTSLPFKGTSGIWEAILLLGISIALAWFAASVLALALTFTTKIGGVIEGLLALIGANIVSITTTILSVESSNTSHDFKPVEKVIKLIGTICIIFASAIIAQQAVRGSPKFTWFQEKAIFGAATGGTSFYKANLTNACFDQSKLPYTDFRRAILTRASFKDVTGLELSRLQGTILESPKVRKLLTSKMGCHEDYTGENLNGANLTNAKLIGANLTEVNALEADFSGAELTDACIKDWNINKNTRFQGVICKRVYLHCSVQQNHTNFREPKPDSGEFQPGEFEKWITDIRDTIDLIFQNGLNWRAFAFSLTQTAIYNEGLGLSVRSIENKGDGVVVAKVGVSLDNNKSAIHKEIVDHYNSAVDAIEAKYQLVLQAKDGEIERLKNFYESQQNFIKGLVSGIADNPGQVLIRGEGNRIYMMNQAGDIMENSQNLNAGGNIDMSSGAKVSAGRDIMGSTIGDLNTQVGNTIQQLNYANTENSDDLVKILMDLQKAVTDDTVLSENQKKNALDAVETLAEEGKKSAKERIPKFCSMAINALKGITATVSGASTLAETLSTYLPTLTELLNISDT